MPLGQSPRILRGLGKTEKACIPPSQVQPGTVPTRGMSVWGVWAMGCQRGPSCKSGVQHGGDRISVPSTASWTSIPARGMGPHPRGSTSLPLGLGDGGLPPCPHVVVKSSQRHVLAGPEGQERGRRGDQDRPS